MLYYAMVFFIIALVAGLFAFGAVVSAFVDIAQILFWVFIVISAVSFIMSRFHGRRRDPKL